VSLPWGETGKGGETRREKKNGRASLQSLASSLEGHQGQRGTERGVKPERCALWGILEDQKENIFQKRRQDREDSQGQEERDRSSDFGLYVRRGFIPGQEGLGDRKASQMINKPRKYK